MIHNSDIRPLHGNTRCVHCHGKRHGVNIIKRHHLTGEPVHVFCLDAYDDRRKGIMHDTDRKQVWERRTDRKADDVGGAIHTVTTETLDFDCMLVKCHTVGVHEGTPVDRHHDFQIDEIATPEAAADYRRRNGYTRIS